MIRRVALAVLVVVGVVVLTFVIARVIPGDPAASWAGPHTSPHELALVRQRLGLDLPLPEQIWRYFSGVLRGRLGHVDPHPPAGRRGRPEPRAGLDRAGGHGDPDRTRRRPAARAGLCAMGPPRSRRAHPDLRRPRGLHARVLAGVDPAADLLPAAAPAPGGRAVRPQPRLHAPADAVHADGRRRRPLHGQLDGAPQRRCRTSCCPRSWSRPTRSA